MAVNNEWLDISVPLTSGMAHWPGDPAPAFNRISDMEQGAEANVTFCRMTAHTGTHMDAPCHFLAGRAGIDMFPLEVGVGVARLITLKGVPAVGRAELDCLGLRRGERILLRTDNSESRWDNQEFRPRFSAINVSGAQYLAEAGVALIGVDYLSVGAYQGDIAETHRILLAAGIWILEGLNFTERAAAILRDGEYDLICLPLRIDGSDGAPVRAILRNR